MKILILTIAILSLANSSLFAGTMASREAKFNCRNANTEIEMGQCAKRHLDKADAELNLIYGNMISKYKDDKLDGLNVKARSQYLRNAQRDWIKFRDNSCKLETYDSIGGSGFGTIYTFCLLKYTQERVLYLRELAGAP